MRASFVAMRWALPSWGAWSATAGFPFHVGPIGKETVDSTGLATGPLSFRSRSAPAPPFHSSTRKRSGCAMS